MIMKVFYSFLIGQFIILIKNIIYVHEVNEQYANNIIIT